MYCKINLRRQTQFATLQATLKSFVTVISRNKDWSLLFGSFLYIRNCLSEVTRLKHYVKVDGFWPPLDYSDNFSQNDKRILYQYHLQKLCWIPYESSISSIFRILLKLQICKNVEKCKLSNVNKQGLISARPLPDRHGKMLWRARSIIFSVKTKNKNKCGK